MNLQILESKLKRHKILYSKVDDQIIIGKSKNDFISYFGLGIFPIICGVGVLFYTLLNVKGFQIALAYVIGLALFLISTGIFQILIQKRKQKANSFTKIFRENRIILKSEEKDYILDSKSIMQIKVSNVQVDEETYEGNIYILDKENITHHLLGFNDEHEKYIADDLKWFVEFIMKHTKINKTEVNKELK